MQIATITVNPCIDKSTTIKELVPEKKLRCAKPILEPGGGGINVARAIKKLGGDVTAVYLAGGYYGSLITKLLEEEKIVCLPVAIQNDTRENTIVFDRNKNVQYRFCMPGPEVSTEEWKRSVNLFEGTPGIQYMVVSGSLPPGVPHCYFADLARFAKDKDIKLVIDTNGDGMREAFGVGVYMAKPNMQELCELAGVDSLTIKEAVRFCQKMISNRWGRIFVVSLGGEGALLVTKNIARLIPPPKVDVKSTVGAGDSMTAGVVLGLARGLSEIEAATYGVACGTAATMNPGTQLCHLQDVELLYEKIKGLKVLEYSYD